MTPKLMKGIVLILCQEGHLRLRRACCGVPVERGPNVVILPVFRRLFGISLNTLFDPILM